MYSSHHVNFSAPREESRSLTQSEIFVILFCGERIALVHLASVVLVEHTAREL
jgi:hypothetical protein